MKSSDEFASEKSLFRTQALEAQRTPWLGVVRLATPASHTTWAIGSVALGLLFIGLITFCTYTRRERVTGFLLPEAGLIDVASWSAGTIQELKVHEGERVTEGEVLAVISGEHVSQQFGDTAANVSTSLQIQRDKLRRDIAGAKALADEQVRGLYEQKAALIHEMAQDDDLLKIYSSDAAAESSLLERMRELSKRGYVSQVQFNQQQATVFAAQAQVKTVMKSHAESSQQLASLVGQIAQVPMTTEAHVGDLERQLEQLGQSLDQNEVGRLSVLRATRNGTISSILVRQGQAVTVGQVLMAQVPKGSPLQAVLLVPSKAVGFIRRGTSVALHYDAFPYQKFGIQDGVVEYISANALSPKQAADLSGGAVPTEPQYEIVVKLASQSIAAYGQQQELVTGMVLDADVLLDRRRLIEWVFEPIYSMRKDNHGV